MGSPARVNSATSAWGPGVRGAPVRVDPTRRNMRHDGRGGEEPVGSGGKGRSGIAYSMGELRGGGKVIPPRSGPGLNGQRKGESAAAESQLGLCPAREMT